MKAGRPGPGAALPAGIDATWHDLGDRAVLWQRRTGRHLPATPSLLAALDDPAPALAARLEALGMVGARDPATWVPVRSRWALWIDGALWHALPLRRGTGGFPFTARPLDPVDSALWRAINGGRTVADLARRLGRPVEELLERLAPWTAIEVQAVQLRPGPVGAADPGPGHLVAPARPHHPRPAHHRAPDGTTTLGRYHREQIHDAATQFDGRETTWAHAFARGHPALGGRTVGAALAELLRSRGLPARPRILEIGPGTGELCAALGQALPGAEILRLDLSPALLRDQARRCPGTWSLAGSATAIPLGPASVDAVICNEVIADLAAGPDPGPWPIRPEPGQGCFHTGAFEALAEIARVLRPGGLAWVSEFGAMDEQPTETTHLDHPEVSIHFGQLLAVARAVGLVAEVRPLADWLGVDRRARWLARPSYEALRARFAAEGRRLEARAWLPHTLRLPWEVVGLHTVPITEPGCGPVVDRILALVGRRPPGAG